MAVTENNSSKFKKCALVLAVASCMSLATSAAEAAGLGKLTILSSLGQPLKAEVEISATGSELVGMNARLAPQDVFKQAGVDYASSLQDLRFTVERRANGKSVLKLSSVRPVNEPFLDFLVELTWPAGRLVREYTFLLDPPEFASGQGMRSSVDARIVETVRGGGAMPEPRVQRQPPAPQKAPMVTSEASPVRPAAAEKPATADKAASATRMVERGDTLRKIAAESQYADVSLEQMLVGLYRNNRDAFIGNDINRLKAGVILNIPDQASVAAVSEKDARHVYVASGDFAAYRRKLAAVAAAGTRDDAPAAQSSAGRITPKVEEKVPAVDPAKDRVKVARADAPAAADVERVAAEKALQEAQTRLASLERNVGELQKLLEMKNQRLAELEKPVAAVPEVKPPELPAQPAAPEGGARIVDAPVPAATAEAPVSPPPEPPQEAPVAEKKAAVPPPVVVDVPVPEEPGLLDFLMDNPLPLAGGAAASALLAGLLLYRRRKVDNSSMQTTAIPSPSSLGPNSVFGMTGGQSVDTGSTPPHTGEFSQAGPGTIDTDEVDPVAEADVYMAYGRDAQAEEILLEAMQKDPNRLAIHAKLLEIYANRRSLKQFETLAGELYAQTAGLGGEWEKVAALGAEIDPENPLYGGVSQAATPAQAGAFDSDATLVVKSEQVAAVAAGLTVGDVAEPTPVAADIAEDELADLDSEAPDEPVDDLSPLVDTQIRETLILDEVPKEDTQLLVDDGMSLDFDLGEPAQPVVEVVEEAYVDSVVTEDSSPDALDFDLGGLAGGAPEFAGIDGASVAADPFQAPAAELPSLELPAVDALAVPDDFAGLDATPDFSPEGTLVISSGPGFGQSVNTDFTLDDAPLTAGFAVSEEVLPEPEAADELSIAEEAADLSELVPVEPQVVAAPISVGKHDDEDLVMDAPDLVNTVVNPVAGNIDDMDFDVRLSDSVFLGQPMMASEFDIGSINLDLAAEPVAEAAPAPVADLPEPKAAPAAEVHDAQWEEVNTKLDLAKAYEEMGDLEGARELLQEVLGEGSADLVAEAETILGRLGG